MIQQIRQGVEDDQINSWLKDIMNTFMTHMATDRNRVKKIPNIDLLREEFLTWLGYELR